MRGEASVLALLLVAACTSSPATGARTASPPPSPGLAAPRPLHFKVDVVATGLEVPWSMAPLPGGGILVSERPGRVRLVEGGQLQPQPALSLDVVSAPGTESGLLGIAVHPGFPSPPDVYAYYTYRGPQGLVNRVSRFAYAAGKLADERVVLDGIPGGRCCHFGGEIAFGPDGMLYVATGDAEQPARAADRSSLDGKILRLRDDGSVPADNPFPGSPVWAWGFRNPEGLAWDAAGRLYASSHGPTGEFGGLCCHDEVDLVQPGGFYGWPVMAGTISAGRPEDYPGLPARVPPVAESGIATWAPAGMVFYDPGRHERPTLLVAALAGRSLLRFVIDPVQPGRLLSQEVVLTGYGRLRDVVSAPAGCAYVLTSNRDGRGAPQPDDDRVLKICP